MRATGQSSPRPSQKKHFGPGMVPLTQPGAAFRRPRHVALLRIGRKLPGSRSRLFI